MTIEYYYFIFGFKISVTDYKKLRGYTAENISDEQIEQYKEEENYKIEDVVNTWFYEELRKGSSVKERFEIEGVKFIVRGFTHDSEDNENVVVGVQVGKMDRWSGENKIENSDFRNQIKNLVNNEEWKLLISANHGNNCTKYSKIDYGVQDPEYSRFSVSPVVYITTNDCDCCS